MTKAVSLFPSDQIGYDCTIGLVRAQLDEATFAKAWAEGCAMNMAQAVQLATAVGV